LFGGFLKASTALGGRLLILLPIAFCIFLLLDSQDRAIRLLAVIGLIILAQTREWLLLSTVRPSGKDNKH
jgi:hypothetical protein